MSKVHIHNVCFGCGYFNKKVKEFYKCKVKNYCPTFKFTEKEMKQIVKENPQKCKKSK